MGPRIVAEAERWLGTPFRQGAGVRGPSGGVDCGRFVLCVFQAAGVVDAAAIAPPTAPDWFLYRDAAEYFAPWLHAHGTCITDRPQPGDVAVFRVGRAVRGHLAIVTCWPAIIHAMPQDGVVRGVATAGELAGRLVETWRVREGDDGR